MIIILRIFLRKNKYLNQFFGTVTKESNNNKNKLTIPQKTEPKKINDMLRKSKLMLSILLKKNGDCRVWSIKQRKDRTIKPVKKPLL